MAHQLAAGLMQLGAALFLMPWALVLLGTGQMLWHAHRLPLVLTAFGPAAAVPPHCAALSARLCAAWWPA